MCFINPKFKRTFKLEVCTAHGTEREFNETLNKQLLKLLQFEIDLNEDNRLRWCLTSDYSDKSSTEELTNEPPLVEPHFDENGRSVWPS